MRKKKPDLTEQMRGYLAALGARGGKRGGLARAKKLTAERRSEIARMAARARWPK